MRSREESGNEDHQSEGFLGRADGHWLRRVYSVNNNALDVHLALLFGLLGYAFLKLECEPAPLILAVVLGPLMEENLRRAMLISRGDPSIFMLPAIRRRRSLATAEAARA